MKIAVTGATGFLGRYIVNHLVGQGNACCCWHRPSSDRTGFEVRADSLEWVEGSLGSPESIEPLLVGCDAAVHAALDHHPGIFRGGEGDIAEFVERNVVGTIRLIEHAIRLDVSRFVFISTCAVHEVILDDRPLDEAHPLWATSHYGAHKAAIEKFVHSYGLGRGYAICALRPTGIYGLARPAEKSKWYNLVRSVAMGESVSGAHGGKEVHAADVARAVELLLTADGIAGQAYNCYDRYVSDAEVARIAKDLSGSTAVIEDTNRGPKHQIDTSKLKALGMTFGGETLLRDTVRQILAA